jgi:hypothetical protein
MPLEQLVQCKCCCKSLIGAYIVIRAAWQQLGNLSPLVAQLLVCAEDDDVLLWPPGILADGWAQVV